MKIEFDGAEKLTVSLSADDLINLDITYDEMDYANIETRRVIWTVLDEAKRKSGKGIDTEGKLLIEASPLEDGGCLLCFTALPIFDSKSKKRLLMKKDTQTVVFCPFDEDALLDALKIIEKNKANLRSQELYFHKNEYFFILQPKLTFFDFLCSALCEFGDITTPQKSDISKIYEYGKPIIAFISSSQ